MKRAIAFIMVIALSLCIFSGCGSSKKDELNVAVGSDFASFNLYTTTSTNGNSAVVSCILQALVAQDPNDQTKIIPELAESWEWSADHIGLTMKLRQDVTYHNGNKFNADDVIYTFKTMFAGSLQEANNPQIDWKNIKAIDEYTVYIPAYEPYVALLDILTGLYIFDKETYEGHESESNLYISKIVGCGPYKIDKFAEGDSCTLTRFDDYFGTPAKIKTINIRVIEDSSVAFMEALNGTIDVVFNVNATNADYYVKESKDKMYAQAMDSSMVWNLYFQLSGVLADENLRKAVGCAIDKNAINDAALGGAGTVATAAVPQAAEGSIALKGDDVKYDVKLAKEYLAKAGYKENELTLRILTSSESPRDIVAEQTANMLNAVGIQTKILTFDTATYAAQYRNEPGTYDICVMRSGAMSTPASWATMMTNFLGNFFGCSDKVKNGEDCLKLFSTIAETWEYDDRMDLWEEYAEKYYSDYFYYYCMVNDFSFTLLRSGLTGLSKNNNLYNLYDLEYTK